MLVDTHCHILPNTDDGAKSLEEALQMANLAVKTGVHTIVATPHHGVRMFDNAFESVSEKVVHLNKELHSRNIPLTILPGQEVRVHPRLIDELYNGVVQPLNGTRYILLELPFNGIPCYFNELLHELFMLGLTPVLAHPERNYEFLRHPSQLSLYLKKGVLCQITSQSIMGVFGRKTRNLSISLCKENWVHLVASDAHNMTNRPGMLKQGYDYLSKKVGSQRVNCYKDNALKLINNEDTVLYKNGLLSQKRWFFQRFNSGDITN